MKNSQSHYLSASTICFGHSSRISTAIILALLLLLPAKGYTAQSAFDSAEKASESLVSAARSQDTGQLKTVLGVESEKIIFSGDKVADKNMLENFIKAYDEKHQLVAGKSGSVSLLVGKTDWPMPIPIVRKGGKWQFDTKAGKEEILNRRIGRNELSTIQTCLAILDAQREYSSRAGLHSDGLHEYAARFMSEPGKKNGLYWPTVDNEPQSPLGPMAAEAAEVGYKAGQSTTGASQPYYGYRYRILTRQGAAAHGGSMDYMINGKLIGGFAIVAWPAEYGNSGIMTFIMNHEGSVYQRNLGKWTSKTVEEINAYDPGSMWKRVELQK